MSKTMRRIYINGNFTGKVMKTTPYTTMSHVGKAIVRNLFPELQIIKMEYYKEGFVGYYIEHCTVCLRDGMDNYFRAHVGKSGEGFSMDFDGCGNEFWRFAHFIE